MTEKPKFGAFRAAVVPKPPGPGFLGRLRARPKGHAGDHCNERQCGDRMIATWWEPTTPKPRSKP